MPDGYVSAGKGGEPMSQRRTGLLPSNLDTLKRLRDEGVICYASDHPILKAAKFDSDAITEEMDCRHFFTVEDQNGTNMCVGGSGAMALGGAYAKEGFDVRFCPSAVYAPICGGRDGGANMADCFEALKNYGAWPAGFGGIDQFDWRAGYRTKFWKSSNSGYAVEAAKYKIVEGVFCETLEEWLAGIQSGGWAGQFGIGALGRHFPSGLVLPFGSSLDSFDGTGINHAQACTGGLRKHPTKGHVEIQGANPWGEGWGDGGFYWCDPYDWLDPESHRGQELWLCRATTLPEAAT